MSRLIDLTGKSFGYWTVQYRGPDGPQGQVQWWCLCVCGTLSLVNSQSLRRGGSTSCGCYSLSIRGTLRRTHGMSLTPEYRVWQGIKKRCIDPSTWNYANYGGRGITVCPEWENSFETFISDMGRKPSKGYTIERIDNNGPYSKTNCRWLPAALQARNKRNNHMITIDGHTACLMEWIELKGISLATFQSRKKLGWEDERAIMTPPNLMHSTKKRRENTQGQLL